MEQEQSQLSWCEREALRRRRNRYFPPVEEMFDDPEFWVTCYRFIPLQETPVLHEHLREIHRKCREAESLLVTARVCEREQMRAYEIQTMQDKCRGFFQSVLEGAFISPGLSKLIDSIMAIPLTVKLLEKNVARLAAIEEAIRRELKTRNLDGDAMQCGQFPMSPPNIGKP